MILSKIFRQIAGSKCGSNTSLGLKVFKSIRNQDVRIGSDSVVHCRFSFDRANAKIRIGDRCYIGASHLVAAESITIGNDVVISWGVTIVDHNSHSIDWSKRRDDILNWRNGKKNWEGVTISPVTIGDKVWIGLNAIILKGVNIGEGSVVGAGSVVTKDILPYTAVAGNPAKTIAKNLRHDEKVDHE